MTSQDGAADGLTPTEREALHSVELGVEWLHRAHGDLVRFHHQIGHAMDHLAEAERQFRETGHEELADEIRDEYLPRGVIDEDRWSYDVLESYQDGFLADLTAFEAATREAVAGGRRHVSERHQERVWNRRVGGENDSGCTDEGGATVDAETGDVSGSADESQPPDDDEKSPGVSSLEED
jgi:hypothetical protein